MKAGRGAFVAEHVRDAYQREVCWIETPNGPLIKPHNGPPFRAKGGTGFVLRLKAGPKSPSFQGSILLITNNHVLPNKEAAVGATAVFDYEERIPEIYRVRAKLDPSKLFITDTTHSKMVIATNSIFKFSVINIIYGAPCLHEFKMDLTCRSINCK